MENKYRFRILEDESKCDGTSKVFDLDTDMENVARIWGSLITMFGQTKYVSQEMEEAFDYWLEAVDSENETLVFSIYHGATGLAIGMHKKYENSDKAKEMVDEFMEKLKTTIPTDFNYVGYYWDYGCKVEMGVVNGKAYARDIELDEEDYDDYYNCC